MKIEGTDYSRFLFHDNGIRVDVTNDMTVQYRGYLYLERNPDTDATNTTEIYDFIEFPFIGRVERARISCSKIEGIYIVPLYIYINEQWKKITNYTEPVYKQSFFYPHLITLPHTHYTNCIHTLHTVEEILIVDMDDCPDFCL
jgi:hypothetical protein